MYGKWVKKNIDILSRVFLLLVIIGMMALISPKAFFNYDNIAMVIFQQAPFTIMMSFGMTLAIITRGIDKSMGSVLVLSNAVTAIFFKNGEYLSGVAIALLIGLSCGALNGILIAKVGIASFIATYGVDFIALGVAYVITAGNYVYSFPSSFRQVVSGNLIPGVANVFLIVLIVYLFLLFLTRHTIIGRSIYSVGHNKVVAKLTGLDPDRTIMLVYIINGLISVLTGILYLARLNSADVNISGSFTLDSIAAALIGGVSIGGGKGTVTNTVIGAMIIVFIRNGMNILNVSTNWQQVAVGIVIVFSVVYEAGVDKLLQTIDRYRTGREGQEPA